MKKIVVGLLSAAAVATTFLLVRQQKEEGELRRVDGPPKGNAQTSKLSLERIRELGL